MKKTLTNTFGYGNLIKFIRLIIDDSDVAFEPSLANALVHTNNVYIVINPVLQYIYHIFEEKEDAKHFIDRLGHALYICLHINSSNISKIKVEIMNTFDK